MMGAITSKLDGDANHENSDIRVLVVKAITSHKHRLSKVMRMTRIG